ncbi:DEAD/DEAH box helicase [Agrobacterium leguminum]|uniref:DEAD/DEAH box helicase n=1 Tax=Agrobacterium leguminum TaxID=2792015 RepID=A0A9X3QXD8_9HYPH|nr:MULTISPECIES: DEAD/DEAH box helicase [Agrobacterium]MCZ7912295.1 DEAD/DEAH box helicase [Agrobacterium leguminum]RRN73484.1 DEAD/DEAH box helicase [Agrobacterium deltaense]
MNDEPVVVSIAMDDGFGILSIDAQDGAHPIWARLKLAVRTRGVDCRVTPSQIILPWPDTLNLIREFGSRDSQRSYGFRFRPEGAAGDKIKAFALQLQKARMARRELPEHIPDEEIESKLVAMGFTKRKLKSFQLRDLSHLLSLPNGANFSVPGAGKTTVTFALNLLTRQPGEMLLVVAPKAATQAWKDIVGECMQDDAPNNAAEKFTVLEGQEDDIRKALVSGASRFIVSYDLLIRQQSLISNFVATTPTHLVLDESHRMKAGWQSQRGAFLLNIAALPVRRDILSGTPMPQAASDIESQLDFLWPGHGLGLEVVQGKSPRDVLGNLFVRTTKQELGLKPATRQFVDIDMEPGQLALYSIVRNEFLREFARKVSPAMGQAQFLKARRSVMRLLQLSINPSLALISMANDDIAIKSAIADQVMEEGHSAKMRAVMDHARRLAREGQKSVIWTIFTDTIHSFSSALADLNPVFVHGGVQSGSVLDAQTREGRIKKFHEDNSCFVLIANPAAAGEGISLHTVCHTALYADRSYVSTHYLQSIDRIHRLGLPPEQDTNIIIYRSKAPAQIGSIDLSVSRRLTEKIRNMQILLDDPDLHQLALDEEEADDPIDYDVRLQDILDLIAELEGKAPAEFSDEL